MDWIEYKTIRQYRPMGELLDDMRTYGYRGGIESTLERTWNPFELGFQDWVAEDAARLNDNR